MGAAKINDMLVTNNMGLVHACANRFKGRGVEYDELFQAGCVGLVKAAAGFDPTLGYQFSTYAVPAILGEIKRIFRDGGSVKIGRSAKEKARWLSEVRISLEKDLGREPTVREIAEKAGMEPEEAACLLSACLPPLSLTSEENGVELDLPVKGFDEAIQQRIDLRRAMKKLPERDRQLIELRYFRGLTQTVTAGQLGLSQVQVSRSEKRILAALREYLG